MTARPSRSRAARRDPAELPSWPRAMRKTLAAAYVGGVSPATFDRWIVAGRMPAGVRCGGAVLWFREDLDAALDVLKAGGPGFAPRDPYEAAFDHDDRPRETH